MNRARVEAMQYVGYTREAGGILSVVRTLAGAEAFDCILGVGPGFQSKSPALPAVELPAIAAEQIGPATFRQARVVARTVRPWLQAGGRVFHGRSRAGLLVAFWLRLAGEHRVVATVHCLGRQRWFYRAMAALLRDGLYWLGPAMKRHYGVPIDTADPWARCLPDCVPVSVVRPPRPLARGAAVVFGCVGAQVPVKNWELLLRAAAQVSAAPVRFLHAGDEDGTPASTAYAAELRRLHAELQLGDRFEWLGAVDDMASFWPRIDCLIVASRWEAFSVAALEAVAAGVPVLAPAASGTADLVACGGGWVFPDDSVAGLADAIGGLVREQRLREWQRGPQVLDRFLAPTVAAQHATIYRRLIER